MRPFEFPVLYILEGLLRWTLVVPPNQLSYPCSMFNVFFGESANLIFFVDPNFPQNASHAIFTRAPPPPAGRYTRLSLSPLGPGTFEIRGQPPRFFCQDLLFPPSLTQSHGGAGPPQLSVLLYFFERLCFGLMTPVSVLFHVVLIPFPPPPPPPPPTHPPPSRFIVTSPLRSLSLRLLVPFPATFLSGSIWFCLGYPPFTSLNFLLW